MSWTVINSEIAKTYQDTISKHLEKGYINKLNVGATVVKQDSSTTKTLIAFDASARYHDVALNDIAFQGPKLQHELFDVLLRFRRYPVAVMCNISKMYLRIELAPEDRSCYRFLWRDMNVDQKPTVYEFNRLVFGVNSSPFLAQFVSQHHATLYEKYYPRAKVNLYGRQGTVSF